MKKIIHELKMAYHYARRERNRKRCLNIAFDSAYTHSELMVFNPKFRESYKAYQESAKIVEPFLKEMFTA